MDQNQTPSATITIDQNQTSSTTTTMDQNQTPSTTTTMDQNQTSSTSVVNPLILGLKPLIVPLVIRFITFIFLLVSLIVIATNSFDAFDIYGFPIKVESTDIHVYRYMISADVIGMAYILLLFVLTIFQVKSGSPIDGGLAYFEFYGDKVILFLLATGAAAGLGLTVEYNRLMDKDNTTEDIQNFINIANASASLLLLGSISSAISSVFSSLNLPKRSSS
ncbi:CASP-like protein PIMP1 [Capsicum annuum]|uniref:CASP-like protein PIMP1 n=1 Tax=Capsicum annuum TaxID=4072 RepID=UPI0007BF1A1F|nr:CASP-like protein PIMP1 [Capsicum annuum]